MANTQELNFTSLVGNALNASTDLIILFYCSCFGSMIFSVFDFVEIIGSYSVD
jgi:hypothetical protein